MRHVTTTSTHAYRRFLILICIFPVYIYNVERWHPVVFFGQFQDDSIYFSTAKALANGQGYTLISFPGSPAQTKYPIVYPWLLSWIWKLNPKFPDNLGLAVHYTEFFGCWSLVAGFFLLRKFSGIGESAALVLTAILAFQPVFVRMSGLVMSDMPFMASMLTLLVIYRSISNSQTQSWMYLLLGTFAALSIEIRTIGVAVVAGVCCALLQKKSFHAAFLFSAAAAFAVLLLKIPTLLHPPAAINMAGSGQPGWNQVAAYYTNYVKFQWSMGVPSFGVFFQLLFYNLFVLVLSLGPILVGSLGKLGTIVAAGLSVPIGIGLLRRTLQKEWMPVTFSFCFYSCILLVWPYPQPERFLLPFIPILLAALWCEIHRLVKLLKERLSSGSPVGQRVFAGAMACLLVGIFSAAIWNFIFHDPNELRTAAASQSRNLKEREEAYEWIREHTKPEDRVTAWKDVVLYLYTGRQSLRPIAVLPQALYADDKKSEQRDLAHMCDASRHVGARYWMTTADDFNLEIHRERLTARMAQINAVLPIVFQSSGGYAQIHDASCLTEQDRVECQAIAPILFPE